MYSRYAICQGRKHHQRARDNDKGWIISGPLVFGLLVVGCVPVPVHGLHRRHSCVLKVNCGQLVTFGVSPGKLAVASCARMSSSPRAFSQHEFTVTHANKFCTSMVLHYCGHLHGTHTPKLAVSVCLTPKDSKVHPRDCWAYQQAAFTCDVDIRLMITSQATQHSCESINVETVNAAVCPAAWCMPAAQMSTSTQVVPNR